MTILTTVNYDNYFIAVAYDANIVVAHDAKL